MSTLPIGTRRSSADSQDPVAIEPGYSITTMTGPTTNRDPSQFNTISNNIEVEKQYGHQLPVQTNGYIKRSPIESGIGRGKSDNCFTTPHIIHTPASTGSGTGISVRWFRRFYVIYETLTVTAAVIVFMLSTCRAFRIPLERNMTNTLINGNTSNSSEEINYPFLSSPYSTPMKMNDSQFSLPIQTIVSTDIFLSIVITIDVLMRMVFCPALRSWLCSWYTLIDLLSLIPFYCELILYEMIYYNALETSGYWLHILMRVENYLVVLKLFVVLRLFRILRRHRGTRVLLYTIRTTFVDLAIIIVLILESALFFGAAIYFTDDNFPDIPTGFWWALITMSTVGYGDLVPSHTFGYTVAMVCVIMGTLLMSYTIPILVNHFLLYYQHADQLYMIKQIHRSAKRKANRRTISTYAAKALSSARGLVNATLTRSVAKVSASLQPTSKIAAISEVDQKSEPLEST